MALQAQQILQGVQDAIRGGDAYFPPEQPVAVELVETVRKALAAEQDLLIDYQALGDPVPRRRRVEPHRLEERGGGIYLHAYCYLAEGNRVFRLDRIHTWQMAIEE